MFTHKIVATAPTVYQSRSLTFFNLNTKNNMNGSFTGTMDFYSEDDAKDYLEERARMYYDDNEEKLNEALEDVKIGYLTIDAVTAMVIEIKDEEE